MTFPLKISCHSNEILVFPYISKAKTFENKNGGQNYTRQTKLVIWAKERQSPASILLGFFLQICRDKALQETYILVAEEVCL